LLQAELDVVNFGCGSLSASVPAGQAPLGFCLLSFTFISILAYRQAGSSAVGVGHSNEFPACSNTRSNIQTPFVEHISNAIGLTVDQLLVLSFRKSLYIFFGRAFLGEPCTIQEYA